MRHLRCLTIAAAATAALAWPAPAAAAAHCAAEKPFRATPQHRDLQAGETYTLCCQAPRADGTAECVLRSARGVVGTGKATPKLSPGARAPADAAAALAALRSLLGSGAVAIPSERTLVVSAPTRTRHMEHVSFVYEEIQWQWLSDGGGPASGLAAPHQPVGDRPGGGPLELGGAPGTGYRLTLVQQGGTTAQVPMKHGSCGLDCGIHVLAASGNLDVPFKIGMTCPAGTTVVHLAAGATQVLQADSGKLSFATDIVLKPFSAQELEQACQTALGGPWPLPNDHNNSSPTAQTALAKKIKVSGRCSGWANTVYQDFQASLSVTCSDQDF